MKKIILFTMLLLSVFAQANELQVSISPERPVKEESFSITFKIITDSNSTPVISFNPSGLEIVGREEGGRSTKTTYINGHLSVERSMTYIYEAVAGRTGTVYLRDIEVEIDGKKIRHPNKRISVLSAPAKNQDVLAIAEVSKKDVFVGESVLVRYYLYTKTSVNGLDIKSYPKLNKFLKRFHQENSSAQSVRYKGEVYRRQVMYTSQVYAEKPGTYKIDPIALKVQYVDRNSRSNSFGFGGFGFRQTKVKTLRSKPVELTVSALPAEGVPTHFTGLVGKHKFSLTLNKNKFLVNEPIEMKLTVNGPGALELFESPKILTDSRIEEFGSTADFSVAQNFMATKKFNITYLARDSYSQKARKIPFSYFDPETMKYVTVELDLPELIVAGGQIATPSQGNQPELPIETSQAQESEIVPQKISWNLTPIYTFKNTYIYHSKTINIVLGLILFFLALIKGFHFWKSRPSVEPSLVSELKQNGVNYARLYQLADELGAGNTLNEMIKNSTVSKSTKTYLYGLVDRCEGEYKKSGKPIKIKLPRKIIGELSKVLKEREKNNSNSTMS